MSVPVYTASAATLKAIGGAIPLESIARAARVNHHDCAEYLAGRAVALTSAIAIEGALQDSGVLPATSELPCMRAKVAK